MKAHTRRVLPEISRARRLSAAFGVVLLVALAFVPEGSTAEGVALMAFVVLGFATAMGWLELLSQDRLRQLPGNQVNNRSSKAWVMVAIVVALVAGFAVQTWFRPGAVIGGGDVTPPDGTAWIGRLFEPWTWVGYNLGEPSQLPLRLPWAAVLSFVQALGGDPGVAQRTWDTTLYVGAGLSAVGLLASLRLGPVAALVGAFVYLFNPYVFTWVIPYDVYIVALFLLPAIPAVLVGVGAGRLSVWWGAALIAAASPLIGYAFSEPPLVGMILGAALATPLVVAWVHGKGDAKRSVRALLLAIPLLLGTSAYWTVPAIFHLSAAHLSPSEILLGFDWTAGELRTTIRNAFWLNTRWLWIAPEYFPYAKTYEALPLSALRFVLPALAFSALAMAGLGRKDRRSGRDKSARLAVVAATAALFLIFLSTGTKVPGNIIFDRLYNLPFGWLLQEPERFIMVVTLAYGILIAIVIDDQPITELLNSRRFTVPALRLSIVPLTVGTALLVGFPLYTGALVPDSEPPLPIWANHARAQHVQMPAYWSEMAQFANSLPIQGSVLVMPPDDFYEMPYTWYYGAENFIPELFNRHVLVPSYPPSPLVAAVNLTGQSILHGDWRQTESLVTALGAPLVLVRRDIVVPYPNHSILPPNDLAAALGSAPNFVLLRQIGSLDLYALRHTVSETDVPAQFMMINTPTPDLGLLFPVLPPNTALISGEPRAGVPNVVQAPGLDLWELQGNTLVWQPPAPAGFAYSIAELDSRTVIPLDHAKAFKAAGSNARIAYAPDTTNNPVTVSISGQASISNGDFSNGQWGPIGDCNALATTQADPSSGARVFPNAAPGGLPALQLSASLGSACESQLLDWHGGSLWLNVMVNHLQGAAPHVCLWETGPDRCASLPPIPNRSGWSTYRVSFSPDPATAYVTLYLYADASQPGSRTINEYADVRAIHVPSTTGFALLAAPDPQATSSVQLVVVHTGFSPEWQGPPGSQHVLVDGMLNGWLITSGSTVFSAYYRPADAVRLAGWTSLAACLAILLFPALRWAARSTSRRNGGWRSQRQPGDADQS